jgi:hypothetical protein
MHRSPLALAIPLCLALVAAPAADGATYRVANHGADAPGCGSKAAPCRSISQAIALAGAGDKIVVGPGVYGDLDGDGTFEPSDGEEAAPGGCSCMVHVNKPLAIESEAGASATFLTGGLADVDMVRIEADDVTFGRRGNGFRLAEGGSAASVRNGVKIADVARARIEGNVAENVGFNGFAVTGSAHRLVGNASIENNVGFFSSTAGAIFSDNTAHSSSIAGFQIAGTGAQVQGNRSELGQIGFDFGGGGHRIEGNRALASPLYGFAFHGADHTVRGNVATGGGDAGFFLVDGTGVLSGNVAAGNDEVGFLFATSGYEVAGNAAYGNRAAGVAVELSPFRAERFSLGGNPACGVDNRSSGPIEIALSWWGNPAGPGAPPADDTCDMLGSTTAVDPVAKKPIRVRLRD